MYDSQVPSDNSIRLVIRTLSANLQKQIVYTKAFPL